MCCSVVAWVLAGGTLFFCLVEEENAALILHLLRSIAEQPVFVSASA
jgi:hypothetical protein